MAWLCRLLQPRTSRCSLTRPQPQPRSRSSAASRTPRPARRHDDCPHCGSDGTHACAVATTPAPAISLRADSWNHSAASGISHTHAQFYLHGPAANPHCVHHSFGTARSRFRAAACRCPATAGIPVPFHATSATTVFIHSTTAGENCSALHVSLRASQKAAQRSNPNSETRQQPSHSSTMTEPSEDNRATAKRRSAASRGSRLCQLQHFFQQIYRVPRGTCPVSKMMFEIEASGATHNNGHSLGIRMKLEPEGARHTQERLTERLTGDHGALRGRLISGAMWILVTDHPKDKSGPWPGDGTMGEQRTQKDKIQGKIHPPILGEEVPPSRR
ncbi:uncharacterized protein [Molothrus aeneus]|uniref:uncharacterized protein n=1 Tax=Molothrus aeneus TaxID=84833 RepID=UPI00345A08F6